MAADQWAWDNTAFEDGLKNVFEPRKQADEAFKRGQGIIKDAYAIDEQQALLPTKLAESMVNRRKAEANLQYYEENPNALVDAIGSEYDKTRVVNENTIGENQAKITARNEQQAMEELIASKSVITTPEQLNPDGTVRVPATERPTTEIERYELAAASAPTYKQQQAIGAMVKAKYADVVNQAVAQEDFVGAHEAAKKAGIITGDAKLTRLSDDTYTIQTTYGGTRQIGKQALQQMFFSQKTREKMAENNNEVAGRIAVANVVGGYGVLESQSKERVANIRGGTDRYVADKNASSRAYVADQGLAGREVTAAAKSGESVAQGGGVANQFVSKQGVTTGRLDNSFTSALNEMAAILPDMVVTSADRKAGEAGKLGENSLHAKGRAVDLKVNEKTTAFIKSEAGKKFFAEKGITVTDETSKDSMAEHGSTAPHYHLEYDGKAKNNGLTVNGVVSDEAKKFLKSDVGVANVPDFENFLIKGYSQSDIELMLKQGNTTKGNDLRKSALNAFNLSKNPKSSGGATGSF
jgi:hypothetical protein